MNYCYESYKVYVCVVCGCVDNRKIIKKTIKIDWNADLIYDYFSESQMYYIENVKKPQKKTT